MQNHSIDLEVEQNLKQGTLDSRILSVKHPARRVHSLNLHIADRVLYARKAGEDIAGSSVDAGEKITLEVASVSTHT